MVRKGYCVGGLPLSIERGKYNENHGSIHSSWDVMEVRKWRMDELEQRALALASKGTFPSCVVVCDNIRSALNVGSIFRTADAFGVTSVLLCGITACPPHREIFKTALGATETVPWKHLPDTIMAAEHLRKEGYLLIGIEQTNSSILLSDVEWNDGPRAFFFGNEVDGLSEEILTVLDQLVEIPQIGNKHSLNVAVAAGIVLWESQVKHFSNSSTGKE